MHADIDSNATQFRKSVNTYVLAQPVATDTEAWEEVVRSSTASQRLQHREMLFEAFDRVHAVRAWWMANFSSDAVPLSVIEACLGEVSRQQNHAAFLIQLLGGLAAAW
jgi:hypothetical protein